MKYYVGIDTGTTSISLAAINENGTLTASRTVNHGAFLPVAGRVQDPERIRSLTLSALDELTAELGSVAGIGFTGQMHGILYVNAQGQAVSPLYTWQDSRGDDVRERLGVPSGYGMATHVHLQEAGEIPQDAEKLTTISDYTAMSLCGKTEPVLSCEMASSWGCFDVERSEFTISSAYLPRVVKGYAVIGEYCGVPVVCSMGDNQASFKGSVHDEANTLLVNVGTGSQVSIIIDEYMPISGELELRPYGEKYLLVGSALCGGRAYAMLERFYRELTGHECYSVMEEQAEEYLRKGGQALKVDTRFMGTRKDPAIRGSILGISEEIFTPPALTAGVILGILGELHGMYSEMSSITGKHASHLVCSGNGMRKNALMRRLAGEMFGLKAELPPNTEEAACGAALNAREYLSQRPSK